MNGLSLFFFTFAFLWFFGGIALFTWVRWESLLKKAISAKNRSKELAVSGYYNTIAAIKFTGQLCFMMAIFAIPIVVTLLTWYFGP